MLCASTHHPKGAFHERHHHAGLNRHRRGNFVQHRLLRFAFRNNRLFHSARIRRHLRRKRRLHSRRRKQLRDKPVRDRRFLRWTWPLGYHRGAVLARVVSGIGPGFSPDTSGTRAGGLQSPGHDQLCTFTDPHRVLLCLRPRLQPLRCAPCVASTQHGRPEP